MPLSRQKLQETAASTNSRGLKSWKQGDNVVRILPPTSKYFTEDIGSFDVQVYVHYNLGPEGSPPITCPRTFDEKAPCPACAAARKLWRNEATKDLAAQISRKQRFLINVLDIAEPAGVEVREIGVKIRKPIMEVALDPEFGDILDIVAGRNFRVHMDPPSKATGGYPEYTVSPSGKMTNIKPLLDKIPGWKGQLDKIREKILPSPSEDDIEQMVLAVVGDIDLGPTKAISPRSAKVTRIGEEEFLDGGSSGGSSKDEVVAMGSTGSAKEQFEDASDSPSEQDGEPEKTATADARPSCWGTAFQPATPKCKKCEQMTSCMEEFTK